MERFARWLARNAWLVVAATLALTVPLAWKAAQLRIENSLTSMLPAGDPKVAYYDAMRALFGSDEVGVVGVRADDVLASDTLARIAAVTEALRHVPGVEDVISITTARDPAADVLNPPKLLPRVPPAAGEVAALREKLETTPLYGRNLVSPDFRGAAINIFFADLSDAEYQDLGIDDRVVAVLAAQPGPERWYYTGAAHVKQGAVRLMRRDLRRFTPLALLLVLVVLWLSFWTVRGVALPLVTVVLALVWTLGIMVLAGKAISLGTFILPPLLLVVGSSYAIHVVARYYERVEEADGTPGEVVVRAFGRVWLPLLISALTTAVGFGALTVNRITAIRDLGVFAVVGVVSLTVACLTFLPASLALMPVRRRTARSGRVSPRLADLLRRTGSWAFTRRRPILWGAAAVGAVALLGARTIHVDSDFLYYFDPDADVRKANETINREIVGSNPFYVVIGDGTPGTLARWEVLKLVKDLQGFLQTLPGVTSSISIVDYMEVLEAGLNTQASGGDLLVDDQGNLVPVEAPKPFWEAPQNLEPVLAMVRQNPATFRAVVTPDFGRASVLVRTTLSGSRRIEGTLEHIRRFAAERFPAEVPVRLTGTLVLLTGTTSDIVAGQIKSLTLALVVIFVVMATMFLSAKVGFLAIVPNVLPIVIFFGVMGWLGILLNLGTSLIAAIALGIAVDSTIHYMARLNLELRGETEQEAALVRALGSVGVPIVYTTVALLLGFLAFALSSFVPIRSFGILAGATLATSLIANLLLLPALLATTKIITLWDLLGVKLGEDPAQTIPLFRGLRPAQARIVVLMGELKRFGPGDAIVRRGERGDTMYVIIQGRTEVFAGDGTGRRLVAEHRRGDVFGEMGLVRRGIRTADVLATDHVEVLAVDERFLQRIQKRYPRIASKVFLNLTRILSDRLQRTTEQFVAARTA